MISGAIPAGFIAKRHVQSHWGFLWGALVYLSMPAVMAIALQDYQDLCFALPFLVWAWNLFETGWVVCAILGALFAIAPREETIPMAVFCAILARPMLDGVWQWKKHIHLESYWGSLGSMFGGLNLSSIGLWRTRYAITECSRVLGHLNFSRGVGLSHSILCFGFHTTWIAWVFCSFSRFTSDRIVHFTYECS